MGGDAGTRWSMCSSLLLLHQPLRDPPLWRPALLKETVFHPEEMMPDQAKKAADLPVDRDDLEIAQDAIHMAQEELHDTLEQMKEALDAGNAIEPKLF